MKIYCNAQPRGIALIIVMLVITVLAILAGGFAYSMKVETKLARNTNFEGDLEWLGRSGVEFARYVLTEHMNVTHEPWDALNQKWAGGPLGTNDILANISLENNQLGLGTFSVRIVDLERKFNINLVNDANTYILQQALTQVGVNPADAQVITDSFLDWIDPNDERHLSGTETSDYLADPNPGYAPYMAKNGPIDDLSELLLIRGVTPEIYWGPSGRARRHEAISAASGVTTSVSGLVDLFTPLSAGRININTASAQVLEMIPGVDPELAQAIVKTRAGWDGVDGTDDDVPFRSVGELINVPGMIPPMLQRFQPLVNTRSLTYEVRVDAKINEYKRQFTAILRRNPANPKDVQALYFHWQ